MSSVFFVYSSPSTPKAQIARGTVWGVCAAGGHAVSVAVGVVTQVGAAAHAFCLADGRPRRVLCGAFEVEGGAEPVAAPFPDVARDVVDAVVVGGEGCDGCGADVAVCFAVLFGEGALPDVAHVFATGFEVVAPGVARAL